MRMVDDPASIGTPCRAVRRPRITGRVTLPPDCDETRLLPYVLADLRGRGCDARFDPDGRLVVASGSVGRGSIFAVVTNGLVWLAPGRRLQYAFSLRGALLLCLLLAPMAAALAWFTLQSAGLALFGLVAPVLWLYGGNHVMGMIRVADYFGQLCGSAPSVPIVASPWSERTGPTQ